MALIILTLVVTIIGLAATVLVSCLEQGGNYVGDSSMVPGCLISTIFVVGLLLLLGFLTGHWGFWIR